MSNSGMRTGRRGGQKRKDELELKKERKKEKEGFQEKNRLN